MIPSDEIGPYIYVKGKFTPCTLNEMIQSYLTYHQSRYDYLSDSRPWLGHLIDLLITDRTRLLAILDSATQELVTCCPDYVDRTLREAGLDPDEVGRHIEALAKKWLTEYRDGHPDTR